MSFPSSDEAEEIFYQALEISDLISRKAFIEKTCGDNESLLSSVNSLLKDHDQAGAFFQETAAHVCLNRKLSEDDSSDPDLGSSIGVYHLVRQLGEGGGGIVYEAEQMEPVRRSVALKILKWGMDTRRVIARFEAERQALAIMEHASIARVFDAGATATGRPYFVMELVHGTKITDFCEKNSVSIRARLDLMRQVCSAVQHAHQKGIIHRDLKPSNILVTTIDGILTPKVIDFGISKAAEESCGGALTLHGQLIGTPAYMSPEQIRGGQVDIDTRSDVYSLGIVLYELMAGRPPFDNEELLRLGMDEMRSRLMHVEPPSLLPQVESRKNKAPGELNWIVMKALEKDRERRYQTARALGRDIERYLANEPIEAYPPSRWYKLQKVVQRNRLASIAIAAALLTLIGGFTISTFLFFKAQAAERQQARLRADAEEREHVTKAAILLLQGKNAEADAEIEHMGGILTQPSVEATNVFRSLATWSAMKGDWKTTAKRLIALSRVNRFDDSDLTDNVTRDLLPIAPTLITSGDFKTYHDFTQFLIEQLGQTNNPVAAEHVLKCSIQIPEPSPLLESLKPVATVAEKSLSGIGFIPSDHLQAWRCAVLGLWYYRNSRYQEAIESCDRALAFQDYEKTRDAYSLIVRAMARWKQGKWSDARADYQKALILIENKFGKPLEFDSEGYWNDWLTDRLLLKEAQLIITPEK